MIIALITTSTHWISPRLSSRNWLKSVGRFSPAVLVVSNELANVLDAAAVHTCKSVHEKMTEEDTPTSVCVWAADILSFHIFKRLFKG